MSVPVTKKTLLRLIVLTLGGLALAFSAPAYADPDAAVVQIVIAIFLGATIALLLSEAARRRQKLLDAVRLELNKLRRIYHVAKNLAAASQRFRGWFTDMHGYVYGYLSMFSGKDFEAYDKFNVEFRKMSYHIYTLPEIETRKEEALFQDLLRTTASVAEARQQIKELWDNRLSAYGWTVVLLMTVGFVVTSMFGMGESTASRVATGAAVAVVLLAIDLLWEVDTMASEREAIAKRYVDNVGRLELGRRE